MAEKNGKKTAETATAAGTAFDLAKYLPEGVKESDFQITGEREIKLNPEILFHEKIPVCAYLLGLDDMPHKDDQKPWQALDLLLQAPTLGEDENKERVMAEPGARVVLGISGGLKKFKVWGSIQRALADREHVYLVIFRVTGQEELEVVNAQGLKEKAKMWTFELRVLWDKPVKREARHVVVPRLQTNAARPALPAASTDAEAPPF